MTRALFGKRWPGGMWRRVVLSGSTAPFTNLIAAMQIVHSLLNAFFTQRVLAFMRDDEAIFRLRLDCVHLLDDCAHLFSRGVLSACAGRASGRHPESLWRTAARGGSGSAQRLRRRQLHHEKRSGR